MSIACFAMENRKSPDEIDDICGVYGYSRIAFGNLVVILLIAKVFLMATGIADLQTLMAFDLPRSIIVGLIATLCMSVIVLTLEGIAEYTSFRVVQLIWYVFVAFSAIAVTAFSLAPLKAVIEEKYMTPSQTRSKKSGVAWRRSLVAYEQKIPFQGLRIILMIGSILPIVGFLIVGANVYDHASSYHVGNCYFPTALSMLVVHFIIKTPFSEKVGDLEKIHFFSLWILFYGSQVYYDLTHLHGLVLDNAASRVLGPLFHIVVLLLGYPFFLELQKLRQVTFRVMIHMLRVVYNLCVFTFSQRAKLI